MAGNQDWILAVDLGTGGPKTAAVSLRGEILGHETRTVATCYTPGGGATQDPAAWWEGLRDGVRSLLAAAAADPASLAGVGITGQWGSTVPVGSDGRPACDCLLWADTRGERFSARAMGGPVSLVGYSPGNLVRWMRITGGAPSPHGADPLGHELQLRELQPEVFRRTATLLEPLDYLGFRLTGRRAATPASMILSWLTDNRPNAKPGYVPGLVRRSGRDPGRLPELLPTGSVLGGLLPEVADDLGLPAGVPVVAGVPDLHTAYLGSGAVEPYAAHVTISTTSWISCEVPFKRTDVLHRMASVPGLRPGSYLVANNHETAGVCLQWLRDALGGAGQTPSYEELCTAAAGVPVGAGGVLFMPWLNGERTPVEDRNLRGGFLNLSLATGRAELARAVLEGVALNARWMLDAVESFIRRPLPSLRILGGGAESDLWCQIHADVLGRPIERVAKPTQANLRGAALFAAISLGRLSLDEVPQLVPVDRTFQPDSAAVVAYRSPYREFKHLYGRLKGIYARLNRHSP